MLQQFAILCSLAVHKDYNTLLLLTNFVISCRHDIQSCVHSIKLEHCFTVSMTAHSIDALSINCAINCTLLKACQMSNSSSTS